MRSFNRRRRNIQTSSRLWADGFSQRMASTWKSMDEAVICDAAPISIAHNYDFSQGKIPGRFRRGTEPTARRNVTSSVQTKYESGTSEEDTFIRWDEKFRNNEPVSARIVTYQWLGNGKQLAIIYELPYCEITDPVRVAATGAGSIPVTIALKAVPRLGVPRAN